MRLFDFIARGGCLWAALFGAINLTGCTSMDKVANYRDADDKCPACGAEGDQPCSCRPDATKGGFKQTSWSQLDEDDLPVVQTTPSQADRTFAMKVSATVDAGATPLVTPPQFHPALPGVPVQAAAQQAAEPASDVQLVALNEELPPELVSAPSAMEVEGCGEEFQACSTCGKKGLLGDLSWLKRHRCAGKPDYWCYGYKATHWRRMFGECNTPMFGALGCNGPECTVDPSFPSQEPTPSIEPTPMTPAAPTPATPMTSVRKEVRASYQMPPTAEPTPAPKEAPSLDPLMPEPEGEVVYQEDCQDCAAGGCSTCAPPGYLLDRVVAGVKSKLHSHGHGHRHRCAGPPDAFCYGYKATQWRQMGAECNQPGGCGMPMENFMPHDLLPTPEMEGEQILPPAPTPRKSSSMTDTAPAPTPPSTFPQLPTTPTGPTGPTESPTVGPSEGTTPPSTIPDLFPERVEPQPTQEEIPDLFPKKSAPQNSPSVVRENSKWRPATQQSRTPSGMSPIRRTSATSEATNSSGLRFVPLRPVAPVAHEEAAEADYAETDDEISADAAYAEGEY